MVAGYTSGTTYVPGDTASHGYIVQAVNGTCTTSSTAVTGTDTAGPCLPPGEAAPGTSFTNGQSWGTDKSTQSWPPANGATFYTLYRGLLSDLPNLLTTEPNSCTKYTGSSTSATDTSYPSSVPDGLYWYLVTAGNAYGEGSAGIATVGPRIVNSSGICSY